MYTIDRGNDRTREKRIEIWREREGWYELVPCLTLLLFRFFFSEPERGEEKKILMN